MKNTYVLGLVVAFSFGVLGKAALDEFNFNVVGAAQAEVAGMSYVDLQSDPDFKRAVKKIISGCEIEIFDRYTGGISC